MFSKYNRHVNILYNIIYIKHGGYINVKNYILLFLFWNRKLIIYNLFYYEILMDFTNE